MVGWQLNNTNSADGNQLQQLKTKETMRRQFRVSLRFYERSDLVIQYMPLADKNA